MVSTGSQIAKKSPVVLIAVLCLLIQPGILIAAGVRIQRGMPLGDALLELQRSGVKLIFTSRVVLPEMAVGEVPASADPRGILDAILAPHSLGLQQGPNGILIVVPVKRVPAARSATMAPPPPLKMAEEIVVESDGSGIDPEVRPSTTLSAYELEALPHAGDDVFRALTFLPGTASTDTSSQLQVRGARANELLIRLDGQELYEPYHLRDFDNALSIVTASRIAKVSLVTALPASYGDRAAGVLDMVTLSPSMQPRLRLGLSLLDSELQAAHTVRDGRIGGTLSFRRGTTDLLGNVFGVEAPIFSDLFAKADFQLTPQHNLRFHGLGSLDELTYNPTNEAKRLDTEYIGHYTWLSHHATVNRQIFVETALSFTGIQRERNGAESDEERAFEVIDGRELDVRSLIQRWNFQAGAAHGLGAGVEYQSFRASYDYASKRHFDTPLALLRSGRDDNSFALKDSIGRERISLYGYDRIRVGNRGTFEAGLRYDAHTVEDDSVLSPRLSAAWSAGSNVIHLGWGMYSQSHRAYEVMVEDGDARRIPRSRAFIEDTVISLTSSPAANPCSSHAPPQPPCRCSRPALDADGWFCRYRRHPHPFQSP